MPQDWIEFKTISGENGSLRPEYIYSIVGDNKTTTITYSDTAIYVAEPYEQVKQKIMDAERIDLSNVVVEHFTREEYEFIKSILPMSISRVYIEHDSTGNTERLYKSIENKLNEILKEDE